MLFPSLTFEEGAPPTSSLPPYLHLRSGRRAHKVQWSRSTPALLYKGSVPDQNRKLTCCRAPLSQSPQPSRLGAHMGLLAVGDRARPSHAPTFSSQRFGKALKPWPTARTSDSSTCRGSSCGLCKTRDRVRDVPTRTSPKQRKGTAQKWLSNSTGGDASPAAGSRRARRPLSSGL